MKKKSMLLILLGAGVCAQVVGCPMRRARIIRPAFLDLVPKDSTDHTIAFEQAIQPSEQRVLFFVALFKKGSWWRCQEDAEVFDMFSGMAIALRKDIIGLQVCYEYEDKKYISESYTRKEFLEFNLITVAANEGRYFFKATQQQNLE